MRFPFGSGLASSPMFQPGSGLNHWFTMVPSMSRARTSCGAFVWYGSRSLISSVRPAYVSAGSWTVTPVGKTVTCGARAATTVSTVGETGMVSLLMGRGSMRGQSTRVPRGVGLDGRRRYP